MTGFRCARQDLLRVIPIGCAAPAALLALLVMISWKTSLIRVTSLGPGSAVMQFNAALGIALCAAGVLTLVRGHTRAAGWLGCCAALLGAATGAEYLLHVDLGIDWPFFSRGVAVGGLRPSRMSQASALCLFLFGLALAAPVVRRSAAVVIACAVLSCLGAVIALIAVLGYAFGIEASYQTSIYTQIALQTAAALLLIGTGMLVWSWRECTAIGSNPAGWLPLTASVALMFIIVFIIRGSFAELDESNRWHRQTGSVIQVTNDLLGELSDMQRGLRGFVLSGRADALSLYDKAIAKIPLRLELMHSLIGTDPAQQERWQALRATVDAVIDYSHRLLEARSGAGLGRVAEIESTGEGLLLMNRARSDLQMFVDTAQEDLDLRTDQVNAQFTNTRRLVILGSGLAVALLLLANFLTTREVIYRRRAEDTLRLSEERFRFMVDGVKDYALIMLGTDGTVLSWNTGAQRLKGYTSEEIVGRHFSCFYSPADRQRRHPEEELKVAAREGRYEEEGWRFRKDGTRFLANVVISAVRDTTGRLRGYAKVTRDITQTRRLDQAVRDQARILDQVNDTIFVRDLADRIVYWNQGAQRTYGWTKDEATGRITHSLLQTRFPRPLDEIREKLFAQGFWEGELAQVRRDGSHVYMASRWLLQKGEIDEPVRIIETNYDITERKAMERALREQNHELEMAARAKDRFLANMSHELRTPLNGIIGFSQLLADGLPGPVNEQQQEYLQDVLGSAQHLLQLINDILDLSKVEAGKMEIRPQTFALEQALEQVCSGIAPLVHTKRINLVRKMSPTPERVTLDPQRFKQILYNLLSNAVKFTREAGSVEVATAQRGPDEFTLRVSDNGIGIAPENLKRLFKEFEQLDNSTTRRYQGTGLGLALTRKLVDLQGGTIRVESEFGKGTTFTVTLPVRMGETVT